MSANGSRKVFENELKDVYDAEHRIESALGTMAEEVESGELEQAFDQHREETREQIDRLERVFEMVTAEPERKECKAIAGIVAEHEEFVGEDPGQAALDVFDLVAAQKVEHYEIATYGSLAKLADELDVDDVGDILHETLEEEEHTLDALVNIAEGFDFE